MDRDRRGERERKGRRGARNVDVSNRCRWEGATLTTAGIEREEEARESRGRGGQAVIR